MVLYFTGTGNSQFVAEGLADKLQDDCVSLKQILKTLGEAPLNFETQDNKPFVVVFPIYAWNIPDIVADALRIATFSGSNDIYFVGTMESESANTYKTCKKLAKELGLHYKGFTGVDMPVNYLMMGTVMPDRESVQESIQNALLRIHDISETISKGDSLTKTDTQPVPAILSGPVHTVFTKAVHPANNFKAGLKCVSCGTCVRLCPTNNIELNKRGRPVFGNNCVACFACIQHCPTEAIQGKNTKGKGRYVAPKYSDYK